MPPGMHRFDFPGDPMAVRDIVWRWPLGTGVAAGVLYGIVAQVVVRLDALQAAWMVMSLGFIFVLPAVLGAIALIVVGVHFIAMLGIGRLFRLGLAELCIASAVCVGGPASAMALATARGYHDRLLPGVAVGLLGYAAGNYLGLAVAGVLRGVLGG